MEFDWSSVISYVISGLLAFIGGRVLWLLGVIRKKVEGWDHGLDRLGTLETSVKTLSGKVEHVDKNLNQALALNDVVRGLKSDLEIEVIRPIKEEMRGFDNRLKFLELPAK